MDRGIGGQTDRYLMSPLCCWDPMDTVTRDDVLHHSNKETFSKGTKSFSTKDHNESAVMHAVELRGLKTIVV